jgi:tetratricopeptide (TPR) repeat protein
MPADPQRVKDLFIAVSEVPAAERAAVLDRVCAGDADLRKRVEALLNAHEEPNSFLNAPAENGTGAYRPDHGPEVGQVFAGRFKLREELGEGGMGVVFVADQLEPVQRRVALKVIKTGADSARVLARFEQERQALALMDHPNIAKVLDAGVSETGQPFFVMELIKGVPLTRYCDEARLTPRQRLELFIPVCQAVQHAHQKGIIHRDLKPSNILIGLYDGKPVPKVIDFGVAKATGPRIGEHSIYTEVGSVIGTLEYMSPEQAELNNLDIDTRSDVYALGVILYELLTGTVPFSRKELQSSGFAEMLRIIKEQEPPRPSTRLSASRELPGVAAVRHTEPAKLSKLIRGDLDWITMKALEKDRSRRYETANGLALDIERYLTDEPVLAGPPSAGYRLRKAIRRHRGSVLAAAVVATALFVGATVATWQAVRATRAEREARAAAEAEKVAAAQAQSEKQRAEKAEADTLADFRASTDDAIEQLIGSKAELGPKEKAYLENTLKRWQSFAARQGDDEHSRAIRGEGHFHIAFLWALLGHREEARTEYQVSVDLQKKLVEQFPDVPAYRFDLAKAQHNSAILLEDFGKNQEAMAEFQAAGELQQKLVEQFPARPEYQQELARTHNSLAVVFGDLEKREEARREHQAARDILKKLVGQFPDVPAYRQDLARIHDNLGVTLVRLGRREEARVEDLAARDILKTLVQQFPGNSEYRHLLAVNHDNLGLLFKQLGKHDEARVEYLAAGGMEKRLADEFPAVPEYPLVLARTRTHLGNLFASFGNHAEARTEYDAARDIQNKLVEQFPRVPMYQVDLAASYDHTGNLLYSLGEIEEARSEYQAARDILVKLVERFPRAFAYQQSLGGAHSNLGVMLVLLGKPEEARPEYEAARDIQKRLAEQFVKVPAYRHNLANTHINVGNLHAMLGKRREAWAEYQAAQTILGKLVEQFPSESVYQRDLGLSYCNTGNLVRDRGEPAESLEWYDRAVRTLDPVHDKEPRDVTAKQFLRDSHLGRAISYDRLQKSTEAIKDWDRAIELSPPAERPGGRARRATSRLQAGQVTEAVAEVAALTAPNANASDPPTWNAAQWYDFACVYAAAGGTLPEKKQECKNRAMELLGKAVAAGYKDSAHMKKDTDLEPLRDREDFKKLVDQLEAQSPQLK